jgi:hypothetical protein
MFFVQFPHPGKEHSAPADVMPWNTSDHGRKFLLSPGSFVDHADQVQDDDLAFWGEWEPASRVVARWSTDGRLPRALHRPFWSRPKGRCTGPTAGRPPQPFAVIFGRLASKTQQ